MESKRAKRRNRHKSKAVKKSLFEELRRLNTLKAEALAAWKDLQGILNTYGLSNSR